MHGTKIKIIYYMWFCVQSVSSEISGYAVTSCLLCYLWWQHWTQYLFENQACTLITKQSGRPLLFCPYLPNFTSFFKLCRDDSVLTGTSAHSWKPAKLHRWIRTVQNCITSALIRFSKMCQIRLNFLLFDHHEQYIKWCNFALLWKWQDFAFTISVLSIRQSMY